MTLRYDVVEAPSNLGLRPGGVELLPQALLRAGLRDGLEAEHAGRVQPPRTDPRRDPKTGLLNGPSILAYSRELANVIMPLVEQGRFPVVLGGDCSILLGPMLALRRLGRYGLFFLDGHADFYQPEAEPSGEVASMELALVSGRGPSLLTDINGLSPLVRDQDVVAFGFRDEGRAAEEGSQDIRDAPIEAYSLDEVSAIGVGRAAVKAVTRLERDSLIGFWIHLDADVLDDAIMPAVDYRQPGGISYAELSEVLNVLISTGRAVGLTVTILNPRKDPDGVAVKGLAKSIVRGLKRG